MLPVATTKSLETSMTWPADTEPAIKYEEDRYLRSFVEVTMGDDRNRSHCHARPVIGNGGI